MSSLDRLALEDVPLDAPHGWRATVSKGAASATDLVSVVVDATGQEFDGAMWTPRGHRLPARGDECVVVFDEADDPHVVAFAGPIGSDSTKQDAATAATDAELNAHATGALHVPEAIREVNAAGQPAFQNGWVNFGAPWATAAFYKDPMGVVRMRGLVKTGTIGTTVFTLPTGYRPPGDQMFSAPTSGANAVARIYVLADGQVQVNDAVATAAFVSLSIPPFRAA